MRQERNVQDVVSRVVIQEPTAEETTAEETTPEDPSHFFAEEPVDEGRPVDAVPKPAHLHYTSVAELAMELGVATEDDAHIFSSSNQRKLFKANSWSPLDSWGCKISTGNRVKAVIKANEKVMQMVKKFEDQGHLDINHEYQTPGLYVEKSSVPIKYHVLGYLDKSTRLIRVNGDPQDIFIAKFKSWDGAFNGPEIELDKTFEEAELEGPRYAQVDDQASVGDVVEYMVQVPDLNSGSSRDMGKFIVEMTVEDVDCTSYGL